MSHNVTRPYAGILSQCLEGIRTGASYNVIWETRPSLNDYRGNNGTGAIEVRQAQGYGNAWVVIKFDRPFLISGAFSSGGPAMFVMAKVGKSVTGNTAIGGGTVGWSYSGFVNADFDPATLTYANAPASARPTAVVPFALGLRVHTNVQEGPSLGNSATFALGANATDDQVFPAHVFRGQPIASFGSSCEVFGLSFGLNNAFDPTTPVSLAGNTETVIEAPGLWDVRAYLFRPSSTAQGQVT